MDIYQSRSEMHTILSLWSDGISEASWARDDPLFDYVNRWFMFVKLAEQADTFSAAWSQKRMTVRAIKEDRKTGVYTQSVLPGDKEYPRGVPRERQLHEVRVLQGVEGLKERMNPLNWLGGDPGRTMKYTKGLHDNSACLLNPDLPLKIGANAKDTSTQMYRLTGDTLYVWMPLPPEEDMIIFGGLCDLARHPGTTSPGFKSYVDFMRRRFTRIKFTFEGDGGCGFRDFAPEGSPFPKIKYGYGNFLKVSETPEQVYKRKLKAREYTTLLRDYKGRNEIIMKYREHGWPGGPPSNFPMFAKAVFAAPKATGDHLGFVVVNDMEIPTGEIIDLHGQLTAGTDRTLNGYVTTPTI